MLKRIKYACAVLLGKVEIPTEKIPKQQPKGGPHIRRRMPVKTGTLYTVPVGLKPVDVYAVTFPYFTYVKDGVSKNWNKDFGPEKKGFLWLQFNDGLYSVSGTYDPHAGTIRLVNNGGEGAVELIISFIED